MSSNEIERESWLNAVPEEIIKRLTKLLSLFISCASSSFLFLLLHEMLLLMSVLEEKNFHFFLLLFWFLILVIVFCLFKSCQAHDAFSTCSLSLKLLPLKLRKMSLFCLEANAYYTHYLPQKRFPVKFNLKMGCWRKKCKENKEIQRKWHQEYYDDTRHVWLEWLPISFFLSLCSFFEWFVEEGKKMTLDWHEFCTVIPFLRKERELWKIYHW